ncbi:8464_t:CDS:2, partial [Diversispora eburnea]
MCRLLVYKGKHPIQLAQLLTRPAHSIINQSFDSRLRLDTGQINGDGFGVDKNEKSTPCIFTSVTPAWNNQNLTRLAEKIKSSLVFAHVRASTAGVLSETNCHPWQYERLMWMHNGDISNFNKLDDPKNGHFDHTTLKDAMLKTIGLLNTWAIEEGIDEPSLLNFAVTDGQSVICTRYISSKTEEAASLYFSSGTSFVEYKPGHYKM